jgi:arylsulfatase
LIKGLVMRRPNILLLLPDQLRGDWAGPGNAGGVRTPNLDRLIRGGVSFVNAICPSPICGPSRACLSTGYEYDRAGVRNNKYSSSEHAPNMYRQLRNAGYEVLTCGKLDLLKGEPDWGADGQHARSGVSRLETLGFTGGLDSGGKHAVFFAQRDGHPEPYFAYLRSRGLGDTHVQDFARRKNLALGVDALEFPGAGPNYLNTETNGLPQDAYCDDWVGQCGLDAIREAVARGRPWFLQVNFPGPHEPMDITAEMAARVADREPPLPHGSDALDPATHRRIRRNYTAMVENIDAIVGRYVDAIGALGQLDDTVIVFTSDHGEMLGDCGLWEKFVPHQPSLHVPLVLAGPGVAKGATVTAPATLLDVHATALELAGAEQLRGVDSRSLVPVLSDPSRAHRELVFSGLGQWRVVYDGRFKLVAGYDPAVPRRVMENAEFELADRSQWRLVEPAADPCETQDLSGRYPEVVRRLREALVENATRAAPASPLPEFAPQFTPRAAVE